MVFLDTIQKDLQQFWNRDVLKCGFAMARFRIEGKEVRLILLLMIWTTKVIPKYTLLHQGRMRLVLQTLTFERETPLSDNIRRREYDKARSSANLSLMETMFSFQYVGSFLEGFLQALSIRWSAATFHLGSSAKPRKGATPYPSLLFGDVASAV